MLPQTLIILGGHSPLFDSYLHWTVSSVKSEAMSSLLYSAQGPA